MPTYILYALLNTSELDPNLFHGNAFLLNPFNHSMETLKTAKVEKGEVEHFCAFAVFFL